MANRSPSSSDDKNDLLVPVPSIQPAATSGGSEEPQKGEPQKEVDDLTETEPRAPVKTLPHPKVEPYDPAKDREKARSTITTVLLVLLGAPIVLPFVMLSLKLAPAAEIKELLTQVLTPIVALVGTAIGFYFGEKSKN